ncbi:ABC transporter substrate-binding protein [Pseudomonas syringae]|uniref:ABC transporter substrate-binding protein n=1 Tax=Pseudomonas syringae TaxID=317 RepID=UPI0013737F65|nr:ABC transporter substrate-binding protein [Pseudomonas syringae]NAT23161.1 ABC transporter substrate-binding protein [Pseudomonas syringae pv. actinidifoliorum]NAT37198.1 ABC transporter substrate-binding protein [Pseudomonas syringae pv. actinidifoliorum]
MTILNAEISARFAPNGTLRASINVGNPILARLDESGAAVGVSVDLAFAFAGELGVPLELRVFKSAGESVAAVSDGQADFGFFAIDPIRGEQLAFTEPYVLIEGCYLVQDDSPLQDNDEVDQAGVRVVVGKGSAYDLHLTRELKVATIIRSATSPTVVDTFVDESAEVAAGVKQQLEFDAGRFPGLRLLPGRFMEIRQAMGVPHTYGEEAAEQLRQFVERVKASGFVADALERHGIVGATVAS